jgi:hypothetical protein
MTLDEIITKQIREINVDLTIVSVCFLILIIPALYLIPEGILAIDQTLISFGTYNASFCYYGNYCSIIQSLLNWLEYLIIAMVGWTVLNVIQMICLSINNAQQYFKERWESK